MIDPSEVSVPSLIRVTCPGCEGVKKMKSKGVDKDPIAVRYGCPREGCDGEVRLEIGGV